jgi:hypothetical protein
VRKGKFGLAADDWTSIRCHGALLLETLNERGRARMVHPAARAPNVLSFETEAALTSRTPGRPANPARRGWLRRLARLRLGLSPCPASVSGSAARQSGR